VWQKTRALRLLVQNLYIILQFDWFFFLLLNALVNVFAWLNEWMLIWVLLFYKKQETQQVNLILYLIIETREVLSTYTLLPHLIRILNIFGRFPALLFFIKKISEDFFIYGNERWGGGDKTCKIRKKQKTKRKNVHVQFEEKNEDFGKPEFTWEPFF